MSVRRLGLIVAATLALSGCKEEQAALPQPVEMTEDAMGFYCQMALLDHDGPKGQVHLDGMPSALFFSQVKDTVAYLHMPEQSHAVVATYVQDMGGATWDEPGAWVAVDAAYYVIGSDALGGMKAPEFVPFSDRDAAEAFARKRGGEVRHFRDIRREDVLTVNDDALVAQTRDDSVSERLNALGHDKDN